jgi:hypothetical protein
MRVLPGLLLGACFVLGMALVALLLALLRLSLLRLIRLRSEESVQKSGLYAGIGQMERIKCPAFLPGLQT